ncbi:hypothetical protein PQJ75_13815 [Rhodoplanes sp. TEM]|uniref:Uncharacterized protein n=1 Tax=Rhodoplanes tepidamans TaxID=200616 RepID=A0ABT5JEW4_RHOTP|nr:MULTISPECIES: hypothetical protein [Rhodoplanes]MDC7787968.1 hypothetical protein [Rhodoplanes tepidamans]MDC7984808.1 hypothetical protein [Rhodoplanes sp. TEM]MDQ0358397.1 hypothetical protein [Rhodoplanes tepidamans]
MSTDPITAVHQAVEARLRTVFAPSRWPFELVPSPMTLDEFKGVVAKATPWLGFSWRSIEPDANAGRTITGRLGFTLTIVIKNTSRAARFLGDRVGPGLYPSTIAAAALLHGLTVPGVGTLSVTRAGSAFADGWSDVGIAIATVDVDVGVDLSDALDAIASSDDFLRLVTAWDLDAEAGQAAGEPTDTILPRGT